MNRSLLLVLTFLATLLVTAAPVSPVMAAKKRVAKTKTTRSVGVAYSKARLSRPTNSVVVTFLNLTNLRRISYSLSYTAAGIPQGVMGSIAPSGQTTDSRDLYFGTCSRGVCTPHRNIQNARLTVTTSLKSGATVSKRYIIKI